MDLRTGISMADSLSVANMLAVLNNQTLVSMLSIEEKELLLQVIKNSVVEDAKIKLFHQQERANQNKKR